MCVDSYGEKNEAFLPMPLYLINTMRKLLSLFSALPFLLSAQPAQPLLYAEPYLQNVSTTAVTVMYQSHGSVHSWVEVGTDSLHTTTVRQLTNGQEVVHDIEHRVRLEGLTPGATYYYRVCATEILKNQAYSKTFGRTARTPFYRFTLPADTTRNFTALVLNDLHGNGPTIAALSALAETIPHDFVVFNGDCLSEPATREHAIKDIHWLASAFHAASIPCIFLRGNHEIRNAYSSGMPSLFEWSGHGTTYHAFSWGDTRFVMLDCGEDKPDSTWVYYGLNDFNAFRRDQADFLKQEISSKAYKKARRHVLIHHIPLWFERENDPGAISLPCRELWLPWLKKAAFDVSINAHVHEFRYAEAGTVGNPYPVLTGGGPSLESATLTVVRKQGKYLEVQVLDAKGNVRHATQL